METRLSSCRRGCSEQPLPLGILDFRDGCGRRWRGRHQLLLQRVLEIAMRERGFDCLVFRLAVEGLQSGYEERRESRSRLIGQGL